jgi:ABC-type nitrate/sulfonate/bicarbonate transport system permease component
MSSLAQDAAAAGVRVGNLERGWSHRLTHSRRGVWAIRVVTLGLILGTWQLVGSNVNSAILVPPTSVAVSFYQIAIASPQLVDAMMISARAFLIGYAAAIVTGVAIGLLMGRSRRVDAVLDPWVFFLYAIPSIALIPLLVMWFGIDDLVRVVLVFLSSVFTIIINTAAGVKHVDEELIDVGRVFCASERQLARTVVLPAAFPYIFAGIRVAMSQAIVGVIGAEFLVVITGVGGMILTFANFFQTANMFVPIIALVAVSLVLSSLMNVAQARINRWQDASERER